MKVKVIDYSADVCRPNVSCRLTNTPEISYVSAWSRYWAIIYKAILQFTILKIWPKFKDQGRWQFGWKFVFECILSTCIIICKNWCFCRFSRVFILTFRVYTMHYSRMAFNSVGTVYKTLISAVTWHNIYLPQT